MEINGIDENSFPRKTIPNYFKNIRIQNYRYSFGPEDIESKPFCKSAAAPGQKEIISELRPEIEQLLRDLFRLTTELDIAARVLKSLTPVAMLSQIQQKLNAIKAEEEVLFTNDFNRLIG
ncbi:MAG: hypothetical protein AAF624_16765, partial [Bacteroidota bacterium]